MSSGCSPPSRWCVPPAPPATEKQPNHPSVLISWGHPAKQEACGSSSMLWRRRKDGIAITALRVAFRRPPRLGMTGPVPRFPQGQKNHELVPTPLVEAIARLKHGGCVKVIR